LLELSSSVSLPWSKICEITKFENKQVWKKQIKTRIV